MLIQTSQVKRINNLSLLSSAEVELIYMRACGNGVFDLDQLKVALLLVANKVFNSNSDENLYLLLNEFILPLIQT